MELITDLPQIFRSLKILLQPYSPPLVSKENTETSYDLWSIKNIEIAGRKRSEVFFASIVIQKKYVGFYFMPVYIEPEIKKLLPLELLGRLKGKSCFHINKLDVQLREQIRLALEVGYAFFEEHGWV